MLLAGVDRRFVQNTALAANDTAVAVRHDPPADDREPFCGSFRHQDGLRVVIGASQFEQFWLKEVKARASTIRGSIDIHLDE